MAKVGTPEWREKISVALKAIPRHREWRENIAASLRGHHLSLETRQKISKALKGREHTEEFKRHLSQKLKGDPRLSLKGPLNPSYGRRGSLHPMYGRKGPLNPFYGKTHTGKAREVISRKMRELWRNPQYVAKVRRNKKPTNIEQEFINNIKTHGLPFKYVGDGSVVIYGLNPDFIKNDGKKVCVEICGRYWHTEEEMKKRVKKFAKYGWKCIVIWEEELKNENRLFEKVLET